MFSNQTINPQVFAALTQLSSVYNSVTTRVCHVSSSKQHTPINRPSHLTVLPEKSVKNASKKDDASTEEACFADNFKGIELKEMCLISTFCCSDESTKEKWTPSHVSAETFFENKTGFSENLLHGTSFHKPLKHLTEPRNLKQLMRISRNQLLTQQRREFKTYRSEGKTGIHGSQTLGKPSSLRKVFEAMFIPKSIRKLQDTEGTAVKEKSSDKFQTILRQHSLGKIKSTDHVTTDESGQKHNISDQLKLSFAEGYAVGTKTNTEDDKKSKSRYAMWVYVLPVGIGLYLTLKFLTALGDTGFRGILGKESFEFNPEDITVSFDDVKGVDEAKQELQDVVEFLRDPDKFTSLGAKLPNGVLLVGPPGVGKTLLARAVAGEAGVPFFYASGSEFDEMFVGLGAKRVRRLFFAAKTKAPCVIFLDEIDSVGAKRTSSMIHPYANQTINQLLAEMDGFQENSGVIILGATNKKENLDQALLRPGRFDVEVRVFKPDLKGRKDILELYLKKVVTGKDVDVDKLARGTTGFTGADLENMVNQAALKAAMDTAKEITTEHLEFARDKVLMGPEKKSKIMDDEANLLTACHEAGHTVVAFFTKDATALHKVTIIPRGMSLGHTSFIEEKELYHQTKAQLMAEMDVLMGGRVAEELIYGVDKVTTGASSDFQRATAIATAMVKKFGMSEKVGVRVFSDGEMDAGLSNVKVNEVSPTIQDQVDGEIQKILQESYERAKTILKTKRSEHNKLSKALMQYETLDKDEIKCILENKLLKRIT